jgi:glyoxylase-like metal-dependent hydrolase (beta-lactamase superfamily II)
VPPFKVLILPVTAFQQNCSIIVCAKTNKAAIVDPGGDLDRVEEALKKTGAVPEKVLLTHGHFDHVGGATELAEKLNIPIEGPQEAEMPLLQRAETQAASFGMSGVRNVTPDHFWNDGDEVKIGALTFRAIHTPGHSPGSICYVWQPAEGDEAPSGFALVGDVLFQGSVGRTDLFGGDHATLISSIKDKLLPLGDDIVFISGHGPMSSFGEERKTNPYLQ